MEEEIKYVRVFTPYHKYHHEATFFYYVDELGELPFGTAVLTTMGFGVIIDADIPAETVQLRRIYCLERLASEEEIKLIQKDWWNTVVHIAEKITDNKVNK